MSRQELIKMRPVSVVMRGSYAGARVLGESPIMPAVTFPSPYYRLVSNCLPSFLLGADGSLCRSVVQPSVAEHDNQVIRRSHRGSNSKKNCECTDSTGLYQKILDLKEIGWPFETHRSKVFDIEITQYPMFWLVPNSNKSQMKGICLNAAVNLALNTSRCKWFYPLDRE